MAYAVRAPTLLNLMGCFGGHLKRSWLRELLGVIRGSTNMHGVRGPLQEFFVDVKGLGLRI